LPNIPIVINKALGSYNSLLNSKAKIVYENSGNAKKPLGIIAYKPTEVVLMNRNNLYTSGSKTFANHVLPVDADGSVNYGKIYVKGDVSSLGEIQANDLVYIYETEEAVKSTITLEVVRSQAQGFVSKIETYNNLNYYTINNVTYKTGEHYISGEDISVNDYVNLILDDKNEIAKINILAFGKEPTTYGVVISSSHGVNDNATVKILDQFGYTKHIF